MRSVQRMLSPAPVTADPAPELRSGDKAQPKMIAQQEAKAVDTHSE